MRQQVSRSTPVVAACSSTACVMTGAAEQLEAIQAAAVPEADPGRDPVRVSRDGPAEDPRQHEQGEEDGQHGTEGGGEHARTSGAVRQWASVAADRGCRAA
jgi:hypothetical protein